MRPERDEVGPGSRTPPGPRHRARVELWKRALRTGQVTEDEVRDCVPNDEERALLGGCLRAAEVAIVAARTAAPEAPAP